MYLQLLCVVDEVCIPAFLSTDEIGKVLDDIETMCD